uniref:Uncharacterized protein n=1 Tax=Lepeophtheirus salmonis TaxID=72036 RepID=A0A0K2TJJ2_LEPSM
MSPMIGGHLEVNQPPPLT